MNKTDLKKYLSDNYDIWKYATRGMKEFKCTGCGVCCQTKHVELLPEEYIKLRRKLSKSKFVKVHLGEGYYIPALKPPCPFLKKDNSCGIHKDRMFACWLFPMTIHKGNFPEGIQFVVNETCPDIKKGEQYNFTREEYNWAITKLFAFADLDKNTAWKQYKKEIESLEPHPQKEKIPKATFTWCPVCRRPYKDIKNHHHPLPEKIAAKVKFLHRTGHQFKNKKLTFRRLLYRLLKPGTTHQSLLGGGMKWQKPIKK